MTNRVFPDFIVIGGMKCGTTTLYEYLARHPSIFMSTNKEPSYFSDPRVNALGDEYYASLFEGAREDQLCGEASTSYTRYSEYRIGVEPPEWVDYLDAPRLLHDRVPDAKLIYLLRDPVKRAYSHYSFLMQYHPVVSFAEAVEQHEAIISASRYIEHAERFLKHFRRDQLLFVMLDDLQSDPERTLDTIQQFLGVDRRDLASTPLISNPSGSGYASHQIQRRMEALKSNRFLWAASRVVPTRLRRLAMRSTAHALIEGSVGQRLAEQHHNAISPFTDEIHDFLLESLHDSTLALQRLLGRPLDDWL